MRMLFQRILGRPQRERRFPCRLSRSSRIGRASVDCRRAAAVRTAMQAAVDSTSLAMAKSAASLTAAQLQTNAQDLFQSGPMPPAPDGVVLATSPSTWGQPPARVACRRPKHVARPAARCGRP